MKRSFYVKALWDEEVSRWYSESDIDGLHIETDTLDEFEEVIEEHAADLIMANHYKADDLLNMSLKNFVHTILWKRPDDIQLSA